MICIVEGEYREIVAELRGEHIAGMHEVMEFLAQRLESPDPTERRTWAGAVLDSVTGLIRENNDLVIMDRSQELIDVSTKTRLYDGAVAPMNSPQGVRIPIAQLEQDGINRLLRKDEVYREGHCHRGWKAFARGDQQLVKRLTDAAFAAANEFYGTDMCMGFYVPPKSDVPSLHAAFFSYLGWDAPSDYSTERYGLATSTARVLTPQRGSIPTSLSDHESRFT